MINRQYLRYFLAVVDYGTFTAAARHCRVSQPALSEAISKLEQILDRVLLERSNRRIQLTPAGTVFTVHARRIEAEFLEAERAVHEHAPLSTLRIGFASTLPPFCVEAALTAACRHEGARLEVVEARARELPALLERGRIDAAIGLRTDATQPGETLWTEGYAFALPAAHRLAGAACLTADQIASEVMFVRRDCEVLAEVSRYFTSRGIRPFMSGRTTSEERAILYVRSGLGITVMPQSFSSPGIALVPLAGFAFTRSVALLADPLHHHRLSASRPMADLLDALRAQAANIARLFSIR
jgi:DNA-binding transcriptional LysR family regulator